MFAYGGFLSLFLEFVFISRGWVLNIRVVELDFRFRKLFCRIEGELDSEGVGREGYCVGSGTRIKVLGIVVLRYYRDDCTRVFFIVFLFGEVGSVR